LVPAFVMNVGSVAAELLGASAVDQLFVRCQRPSPGLSQSFGTAETFPTSANKRTAAGTT
jgi:hypothetical protein